MEKSVEILKKYWGYQAFRDKQDSIIHSVLNQQDTLALLPTGGGKSICYQVPGLQMEGLCLVVSPLIALMHDQVSTLKSKGIKAIAITSGMSQKQIDIQLDNAIYGDTKFLYVSPERLKTKLFLARFQKMKINLIAIDEAHCISQWGYDFRPAYLEISELRKSKPNVPILALTATATEQVVKDIQDKLEFKKENIIQKSFVRDNLIYSTYLTPNKKNRVEEFVKNNDGSGIIYCATRKGVKELCQYLQTKKVLVDFYHAGLDFEVRRQKQEDWLTDKTRIIVSTNAFGMGIDKSAVKFVLHYDIPETIEAYFQEAGRAGRDEKPANAVLFYEEIDVTQLIEKVNTKFPSLELIKQIYNALGNHLQLAFGSGKDQSYPIDLNEFCDKYNMQLMLVYNGLKFLESTGYIELTEGMYQPSRLKIVGTQLQLYQEQVKDAKMNTLIQFILRTHMGIFDEYSNINEFIIAQKTNLPKKDVIEKLTYLMKLELVDYIPQNNKPQITYTTERLPEANLLFSPRFYKDRKDLAFDKMKSMILFLESDKCRSVLLLEYFGEKNVQPCGKCSACLEKNKSEKYRKIYVLIKHYLNEELAKKSEIETADLINHFSILNRDDVFETLRWLADTGVIAFDETGRKIGKT